jgi:hypothetical protein
MAKPRRGSASAVRLGLAVSVAVIATSGCAQPVAGPGMGRTTEGVRAINRDPVGYLRQLCARCEQLEQYRLKFYRQERLGLIPVLGPMEEINASFRKRPFSVKFEWPDPKMPYYESVYVDGRNNNLLLIRERRGLLLAPPQVRIIDVDLPVKIGKARNPITVFGLANMVRRTLEPFEDAKLSKVMTITCPGVVDLEPTCRPAYHLRIQRPPTAGYRYTRQDFYVDVATALPAGTDLWLRSGNLDARYRYADVNTNAHLTDEDFRLSKDHPPPQTKPAQAAKAGR